MLSHEGHFLSQIGSFSFFNGDVGWGEQRPSWRLFVKRVKSLECVQPSDPGALLRSVPQEPTGDEA